MLRALASGEECTADPLRECGGVDNTRFAIGSSVSLNAFVLEKCLSINPRNRFSNCSRSLFFCASVFDASRSISSSRRSCQIRRFSTSSTHMDCVSGNIFENALYKGATTNSIKLICDTETIVVSRSIIGETGNPSVFSRSPWLKNSSNTLVAHILYVGNGFTALDISAECNNTFSINCRSSSVLKNAPLSFFTIPSSKSGSSSFWSSSSSSSSFLLWSSSSPFSSSSNASKKSCDTTNSFIFETKPKCVAMSVCMTHAMIMRLTSR